MAALTKAVPSAVAPSTSNSVPVLKEPQLGPYEPMSGSSINPSVPKTETDGDPSAQPGFGGYSQGGMPFTAGSEGAPSVPGMNGVLFTPGPIDSHYVSQAEVRNPYAKVNNPPTRGKFTWVKEYINHIALGTQNKSNTGFNVRAPQQRISVMRITPPEHGIGYAPETYEPRQMPQSPRYNKIQPVIGTDPYGTGVLNADTFGAGQTAGGQGGNLFTPEPGPPDTQSTAGYAGNTSGMPTWG